MVRSSLHIVWVMAAAAMLLSAFVAGRAEAMAESEVFEKPVGWMATYESWFQSGDAQPIEGRLRAEQIRDTACIISAVTCVLMVAGACPAVAWPRSGRSG
jgi:hypothetical protein